MTKRLTNEEFLPFAPEYIGSIRINHESADCSGSSKSLIVSRGNDGSIRAHCFRCGKSGYHWETLIDRVKAKKGGVWNGVRSGKTVTLPNDSTGVISEWPSRQRIWLLRSRITGDEAHRYGIVYSPRFDAVFFPVSWQGSLIGTIQRNFNSDLPKYVKRFMDKDHSFYRVEQDGDVKEVVLVEDVLSAIRVGRQRSCIAMLGTHMSEALLNYITAKYLTFTIWLDNDTRQVKLRQAELARRLRLFGKVQMVKTDLDPKEYSDEDIKNLLTYS